MNILPLLILCGVGIVASATYIVIILVQHYATNRQPKVEYYELLDDDTLVLSNNHY